MEHRKFAEFTRVAIDKGTRFLRDFCTLPFGLELFYNSRLLKDRHRELDRMLFIAIQLVFGAAITMCTNLYLAMLNGTFLEWQTAGLFKYIYHSLGLIAGPKSSNLVLAVLILILQNFNIIDYALYPFLRHYRRELADMAMIGRQIKVYDGEYDDGMKEQIGRQIKLCFNPHMTVSEKIAFVGVFHRKFAPSYLLTMVLNLVGVAGYGLAFLYYLTFLLPFDITKPHIQSLVALCFTLAAYLTGFGVIVLSVGLPIFLVHFVVMIAYGTILSWHRFCATIRRIDASWPYDRRVTNTEPDYDGKFVTLYAHIRHGQRVYMNCVRVFQKVNHCILDMVFYVSASLTLASQVELVIELFANRLGATLQSVAITLIIIEFMLIFLPVWIMLRTSKQLYALNELLLSYQARFAEHRFRDQLGAFKTRAMLRWSLFGEIIHSRKRFLFCVSLGIGRINSMTIVKFVPIYTSFLFMLIPIVTNRRELIRWKDNSV